MSRTMRGMVLTGHGNLGRIVWRDDLPVPEPGRDEVSWGGEIAGAAVAHFAASIPAEYLQNTADLMNCNTRSIGKGGPTAREGRRCAKDTPGLGVTPNCESLGAPVAVHKG